MKQKQKIIIMGAGLAGLSLATELLDEGFEVTILEKNAFLGGRASNIQDKKMHDSVPIGPHVFVTAYNNFRRFLKKIQATHTISWERKIFLEVVYNGQHQQINSSRLPAPLYLMPWLLNYKFISVADKLSNFRLSLAVFFSSTKKLKTFDNINAYDYLASNGVSVNSINKFWRFFVLSMLNIPLELCSGAEFALLLKHWSQLKHRNFGFAKVGLGDLYTEKSADYITKRGGRIILNTSVKKLVFDNNRLDHLIARHAGIQEKIEGDIFVSTLNPIDLRQLIPEKYLFNDYFRNLNAFEAVPYISVNLWFDRKITGKKFWALLDTEETSRYMNTDFYDQSNIYQTRKKQSYITSNVIYSKAYDKMTDAEIIEKTLEELKETFPGMKAKLKHAHVHRIPYVIYAPFPGTMKHKLDVKTPFINFYLAGDWTIKNLTQCMESAVRSGYKCAEEILKSSGKIKKICDDKVI